MRIAAIARTPLTVAAGCAAILALAACGSPSDPGESAGAVAASTPDAASTIVTTATAAGDPALTAALHKAAEAGDAAAVKKLLSDGAIPDASAAQSIVFGEKDDATLIEALIGAGLDPNTADALAPGHSILMWAAEAGRPAMAEAILDAGATIDAVDFYGDPAISVAAFNGEIDVVKLLVARGAALDLRGLGDNSAVGHARSQGHDAVADYLVAQGAPE
jgi:ankyrin repeat protein